MNDKIIGGYLILYVMEKQLEQVSKAFMKERKEYLEYKRKIEREQYGITEEGSQED